MPAKASTSSPAMNGPVSRVSDMASYMYKTCVTARNLEPIGVPDLHHRHDAKTSPKRPGKKNAHREFASVKMGWTKVLKGISSQPV